MVSLTYHITQGGEPQRTDYENELEYLDAVDEWELNIDYGDINFGDCDNALPKEPNAYSKIFKWVKEGKIKI